jgi:hypothetical protein
MICMLTFVLDISFYLLGYAVTLLAIMSMWLHNTRQN